MTRTSTQKPLALRLADKYEIEGFLQDHRFAKDHWCRQAAAELLRQHARIAELEDATDIAIERIAELEAQLSATHPTQQGLDSDRAPRSTKPVEDGWLQDGHMLYRLTDEPEPRNRDEISVTMVNGSRAEAARTERASEILYAIRTAEAGKVMK